MPVSRVKFGGQVVNQQNGDTACAFSNEITHGCMQCKDKHLLLATRDLFLGQQSAFGNGYFQVRTLGTGSPGS